MKKILLLFLFLVFYQAVQVSAQDKIHSEIIYAIQTGNVKKLVTLLNTEVELQINTAENIYSLAQTEIIIKDFFQKNKPLSFELIHEGKQEKSQYFIGKLNTSTGIYRTSVFLKNNSDKNLIYQLRFEKENE